MAYETFDMDLRDGKAREDAFVHVLLRSQVEHKRDKKAARTGNIAIEIAQQCSDGEHRPAGVMATTAQFFAVEFFPECWLLLPTEYVRNLAKRAMKENLHRWIGDGNNHLNALVPIEWFVRLTPEKCALDGYDSGGAHQNAEPRGPINCKPGPKGARAVGEAATAS